MRAPCSWYGWTAWAPDGRSLLSTCATAPEFGCGIVRYHLDGRTETLWERRSCVAGKVDISPDARHIAFVLVPHDTDVWTVDLAK